MRNRQTFRVPIIREFLKKYSVGKNWADPFCGQSTICEFRNDLDPDNIFATHHLEAVDFLDSISKQHGEGFRLDGVVFDPPYSLSAVSMFYKGIGLKFKGKENPTGGFPIAKDIISRLVKPSGIVISFGWNSNGMGKKRGFNIIEILLLAHGGNANDTIITVEQK